eukprot:2361463-Amphidinium_carterae.1
MLWDPEPLSSTFVPSEVPGLHDAMTHRTHSVAHSREGGLAKLCLAFVRLYLKTTAVFDHSMLRCRRNV